MPDTIRDYLESRKQYDAANRLVNELVTAIQDVGRHLSRNPLNFMFSNVEVGMPAEVLSSQSISFDGNRWPSAMAIQNALLSLHQAKQAAFRAWGALDPADQAGLIPPDR